MSLTKKSSTSSKTASTTAAPSKTSPSPPKLHHPPQGHDTSWADEEDKANAKYDTIRGKRKQNTGGGSSNNVNQGGRNNNYPGPNRKRKLDNTVAAI
jgi:hypothetical protein